ncbi:MAG: hypothetical protein LUH05_07815 [Candidatus Gastranaerophilales bacterium]|nr:hypothetical protein [Candidatus Gastranaerophilales bacterium]
MTNIINSIENYQVSNSGIKQEELQTKLAQPVKTATDSFENNSAGKVVSGNTNDPDVMKKTLLLLPPIAFADGLINKAIGGKGEGLLGKAASLGDKISNALHLDKIFSSENESKFSNFIKNNRFTKYFTNDYKAIPKSSFAKSQTMSQKYSQEIIDGLLSLEKNPEYAHLFKYGQEGALSNETLNTLYKIGSSKASKTSADELIKALDDVADKGVSSVKKGLTGKTDFSELKNKLKASDMKMGKTKIGSMFAKGTLKTKDILTFGGGLLSLGFAANAIVQAVKATKEAPKGEKKSTFMHVLSENYIGLALFQPSINLLYKAGGNKYRGMTIEGKDALKELVTKTNADKTLTKEGYKVAKLQKDLLIKGVSKDKVAELAGKSLSEAKTMAKSLKNQGGKLKFWEKPLKAAGKLLDTGLDSIKSPTKLGKAAGKLKGFAAGFGRFAIIMFVIQPFIQKPVTKLIHKIFGEPKTYLAKQEAANKTAEQTNQTPQNIQQQNTETNLIKKWTQEPAQPQASSQQAQQVQQNSSDTPFVTPKTTVPQQNSVTGSQNINNPAPDASSEIPAASLNTESGDDVQPLKPQQNEEIPALNIFSKDKNENTERYIPSTEVEANNNADEEEQALKEANEFIKENQKFKKNVRNLLDRT